MTEGAVNTSQTTTTVEPKIRERVPVAGPDKAVWFFVAALVVFFWVPEFILAMGWPEYWISFLTEAFIWGLFAVAFNLLMGYTGMVSFGQAAYLGIGGYTTGLLLKKIVGFPFALGLIAAPIGGALAALIIGFFCIRRTHIYFAILTLAFGQIVYLIAFKWYGFTGGDNGLIGVPIPDWITEDLTFSNYYKFVLVISLVCIYLLWRIVHSPFGKVLTSIRENPERTGFIGVNVKRYQLYAFMIAGAFSGVAGALMMVNERSVYPDLAHWTQSAQVILMSLLGGVYTFFGPIVGAFVLQTMDADITQNYPELWQLFLGGVLITILYALPGGIMGFIQERDVASSDDYATRMRKIMDQFARKFWYFFAAAMLLTALFSLLLAPESWLISEEWEFELANPITWGIVPQTLAQIVIGVIIFPPLLRGLKAFSQLCRLLLLIFPVLPLALHIYLGTPLSGLLIVVLWGVFVYTNLLQTDVRQAFRQPRRTELRAAAHT
jgi:branched-chain amino acid transport system permease protein